MRTFSNFILKKSAAEGSSTEKLLIKRSKHHNNTEMSSNKKIFTTSANNDVEPIEPLKTDVISRRAEIPAQPTDMVNKANQKMILELNNRPATVTSCRRHSNDSRSMRKVRNEN